MGFDLLSGVAFVIPLVLSLTVHEYAHAWTAARLGDDTAARAGRLTLNPLSHIDLLGSIVLPLMHVPFGWAKPVPIDPSRFRRTIRMSTGMMLTAAAGPISNLILAVVCTVGYGLLFRYAPESAVQGSPVRHLLVLMIQMNVSLAVFNLIPVPPLDGSRILDGVMPLRLRAAWEGFSRFAPFLLIALIFGAQYVMAGPVGAVFGVLQRLLNVVAGA